MSTEQRPVGRIVIAAVFAVGLAAGTLSAQNGGRASLRVGALSSSLRLDGRLEDPAWMAADSISSLTEIEPREGAVPTGRTVARVLMNHDQIVIGVRVSYPDSIRPVTFARERDASLSNEDHLRIIIDAFRDGRSGYVFAVNANGARYDALITNQGESENSNWDAIWTAKTARTDDGWSVEISISTASLLFATGLTEWGFNIQRRVQARQETDRWASADRDIKINQTSRSGLLVGIPDLSVGVGLTMRPAITGGSGIPAQTAPRTNTRDASLDVTQRVGTNALAALTVNTDFAETDVDTRRTNLTRFPLLFPEKRTFFVEGSDIFDFGLGTGTDVVPFFSRRVGLISGTEIPIRAGGKINGRHGGTSYGALVARTGDVDSVVPFGTTAATLASVRVKQNVLAESSVGFIATSGDPSGKAHSWLLGPDVTYQTTRFRGDKNLLIGAWGLAMDHAGAMGDRNAWGAKIDYPNDLWDVALTYKSIGNGFTPSLGFVPRPGVRLWNFNVNFSPRPSRPIAGLHVRQMFHEFLNTLVTDPSGRWESYRIFTAPINWRLESGDRLEVNYAPQGERLSAPFEIVHEHSDADRSPIVIPAGTYEFPRYRLEAGTATKRRLSGQLTWWFGEFYTGRLDQLILTTTWRPSSFVSLDFTGERNVGRLPQGDFTRSLVGSRLRFTWSPDLQLSSFAQYDNETHSVGSNTRLRWTFRPAGDLFVVYNHNLLDDFVTSPNERRWRFGSNQLLMKVQYAVRY
jgi:hypothetical protein